MALTVVYDYIVGYVPANSRVQVVDVTRKLTPEDLRDAVQAYLDGASIDAAAGRFGHSEVLSSKIQIPLLGCPLQINVNASACRDLKSIGKIEFCRWLAVIKI